jgi:hypothetical protein
MGRIFLRIQFVPQCSCLAIIAKQDRQCTYNVTLWSVRVTVFVMETQQYFVCIADLHVTGNNIKMLNLAQKFFCGGFMSPAKIRPTYVLT